MKDEKDAAAESSPHAAQKRVGGFFAADGGGGAVAGVDDGFFREGEDFFADAGKKLIPVAAREIPAADAIREQNIAAIKLAQIGKIQTEAAGTVTGD